MKNLFILLLVFCAIDLHAYDEEDVELIGKEFITQKQLFYVLNQPWQRKLPSDLKGYAPSYLKYNRVIDDFSVSCSNCLNKETLLTPLRIEYLPPGTVLKVKGIFTHRGRRSSGAVNFLVIEDSRGNLSEARAMGFARMMNEKANTTELASKNSLVYAAELYSKGGMVTLTTCNPRVIDKLNVIREDFSLRDEIISRASTKILAGTTCTDFEFSNLTAYVTYRHFLEEWRTHNQSNYKEESCIEIPTDQNKGEVLCDNVIYKTLNQGDQIAVENLFNGWRLTKKQLGEIESNLKFKTWSPNFQLSIIEARDDREVLTSMCKRITDSEQRIKCYLENTACLEIYGLKQTSDCSKQKTTI